MSPAPRFIVSNEGGAWGIYDFHDLSLIEGPFANKRAAVRAYFGDGWARLEGTSA